jgi:hypothetical protein
MYHIRTGKWVYYLTISTNMFDEETMCHPYLLNPQLLVFQDIPWSKINPSRNRDGSLDITASHEPLQEITFTWHEKRIDALSLPRTKRLLIAHSHRKGDGETPGCKTTLIGWA